MATKPNPGFEEPVIRKKSLEIKLQVSEAGKKVREDYAEPVPNIEAFEWIEDARTLPFEPLVRLKLTSFRRKDQVHLLDLISIGLIDATWLDQLSTDLQVRLQELLDDPDG